MPSRRRPAIRPSLLLAVSVALLLLVPSPGTARSGASVPALPPVHDLGPRQTSPAAGGSASTLVLANGTNLPSIADVTSSNAGDPTVVGWDPVASEVWASGNVNFGLNLGATQAVATYNVSTSAHDPPIVLGGGTLSNPVIPSSIVYDARHAEVDIVDGGTGWVRVWNASSFPAHGLVANIPLGGAPGRAAIDGATGLLWVTDALANRVDVVNTATRTVTEFGYAGAWCVAYDAPANQMLVGNFSDLSAFNASTGALSATLPLPCFDLAVDPANGSVFVTSESANVSVVLAPADTFLENVTYETYELTDIAYDPALGAMLVLHVASGPAGLGVLDLANLTFVRSVPMGRNPQGFAMADSVDRIFVGGTVGNNVTELNATTLGTVASIPVGGTPVAVYLDPGSGDLIVPDPFDLGAWVVAPGPPPQVLGLLRYPDGFGFSIYDVPTSAAWDPAIGALLLASSVTSNLTEITGNPPVYAGPFPTPFAPTAVAYDAGHHEVVVAGTQSVAFLNATTGATVTNLTVGLPAGVHEPAEAVVYDPATQDDYVLFGTTTGPEMGVVVEISGATHAALRNVSVDLETWNLALDGSGARLFVTGSSDGNVTALNASTLAVEHTLSLPTLPYDLSGDAAGVAYDAPRDRLYAVDAATSSLEVYNGTSYAAIGSYPAPQGAQGVYVDPSAGEVYVAATFSDALHLYQDPTGPLLGGFTASPPVVSIGNGTILLVRAFGGLAPLTYTYSGLPKGCQGANTSTLACYPTLPGSYTVSVVVSDASGVSASASLALDVVGTAPGTVFHVYFHVAPTSCRGVSTGHGNHGDGTEDNLTAGIYALLVLPCTGYASAYVVGSGAVTANSSEMTVLGNGSVSVTYLVAGTAIVGVVVHPASCGAVVELNGTGYGNGSAALLPAGRYAIAAGSCSGMKFTGWSTSGDVALSGGVLTVSGNGVLTANYTSAAASPLAGLTSLDYALLALVVAAVAVGLVVALRRRRRAGSGGTVPVLRGEPIDPGAAPAEPAAEPADEGAPARG